MEKSITAVYFAFSKVNPNKEKDNKGKDERK
jgi:hypothetical protein